MAVFQRAKSYFSFVPLTVRAQFYAAQELCRNFTVVILLAEYSTDMYTLTSCHILWKTLHYEKFKLNLLTNIRLELSVTEMLTYNIPIHMKIATFVMFIKFQALY